MSVSINGTNGLVFNDASTQNTAATGFGFKNRIINGAMMIDQRNAGASVALTAGASNFITDRWGSFVSQSSKATAQQNAGSVTPPSGFTNYLGVTSSSAYTVGSSEIFNLNQKIEGYNIADLGWGTANAQPVTISFWVRSSLTGTFGGSVICGGSCPFSYTISSANTWELKSVTIPANTSYAPSSTTNGQGIYLGFGIGVGSAQSGTAGAWSASYYYSATGATSVVGTNGATFYITGVQLEKGSTATSFDYRPYGTELSLCQRYFQIYKGSDGVSNNYVRMGYGYFSSSTTGLCFITNKVNMRTQPSVTASGSFTIYNGTFYTITAGNVSTDGATTTMVTGLALVGSGYPGAGVFGDFITNASPTATLSISAEL